MTNKDLRWRKTERALMRAFEQCLQEEPISKITIARLAEAAEINKATFYLHYSDIYDLASAYSKHYAQQMIEGMEYLELFPDDISGFTQSFIQDFVGRKGAIEKLRENELFGSFFYQLTHGLVQRAMEETGEQGFPEERQANIVATFILGGIGSVIECYPDDLQAIETITGLFDQLQEAITQIETKIPGSGKTLESKEQR